jgi:hypothetical protein
MLSKKLIVGGLAAIAFVISAGMALASPGEAISNVNVRSGPGTSYKVVDQLKAGEIVDIAHCQAGWCYVGKPGTDGWVSDSYIQHIASPVIVQRPIVVRPNIVVRPPIHHRPPHFRPPHKPRPPVKPPHKPRPPICTGKPQIQICRLR